LSYYGLLSDGAGHQGGRQSGENYERHYGLGQIGEQQHGEHYGSGRRL